MSDLEQELSLPVVDNMELDLSKDERIRVVALMMSIKYHVQTVVRDPEMLRELVRQDNQKLEHLTTKKVLVTASLYFDFIRNGSLTELDESGAPVPVLENK